MRIHSPAMNVLDDTMDYDINTVCVGWHYECRKIHLENLLPGWHTNAPDNNPAGVYYPDKQISLPSGALYPSGDKERWVCGY